MIELNKIYHENCLDTMKKMDDNSIDLIITSPPYNMNLRIRNGKYCSRQIVKEFSTKYESFDDNLPLDEFFDFHCSVIDEMLRISNTIFYNISIVTGSKRAFFKIIGKYSDYLKDIIIWDKSYGQPAMQNGVLNRQTELILIFQQTENAIKRQFDKCNFERGTLNDLWTIKRQKIKNVKHGATFPEELVEKIILNFSNEGDLIYDPFSGIGTTAVVCKKNKRKYICSEISYDYIDLSNKRLKDVI